MDGSKVSRSRKALGTKTPSKPYSTKFINDGKDPHRRVAFSSAAKTPQANHFKDKKGSRASSN